jgi:SNF family Na+-dependent transporter
MNHTRLRKLLSNPAVGFAPWIAMSVVVGPGRFEIAAVLAFAISLAAGVLGAIVGERPKLLDLVGIAFFAVLIVAGLLVDQAGLNWLERWAGEISNIAIVLVALFSIAIRMPFTIQYARESVQPEDWQSPLFMHINYVVTWAWTGAFAITAIAGYIGDGPLGEPDNVWTNWLIQIALLILALRFTEWYPDTATAKDEIARGERTDPPPSIQELFLPLAGYIVPVGLVTLVVGGTPWWIGVGLIIGGGMLTNRLRESGEPEPATAGPS